VNGARGKVPVYGKKIEGAGPDVLRGNFVSDVDNIRDGVNREYRRLHRGDEIVLRTEISQESDD
jgi:hypothetical protein